MIYNAINLEPEMKTSEFTVRLTWMDGGIVGPQICAAGGGGGGIPPEAPGNQDVEASGSADRMVISGRLATGSPPTGKPHTTVGKQTRGKCETKCRVPKAQ